MRPLTHPSIDDITVEGILHALSDPVRAAIYAQLACADAANSCSAFLQMEDRSIPKSTLSQHFRALREAGLIRSERRGVEMLNSTRCEEIAQRFPGLLQAIMQSYKTQLGARKPAARRRAKAG
ncbi:helix-turn-helix domain-containing protein [Dyella sp. ASV21]|uniref:ArsR/SmtB family transcription factor n=1 Tax=Dyella sp. ASV21 TaxID=2795114 RepID=UPI0018EC4E42|nr:helix-turn-helix domain-containing protein [Dyella sp. ASV21]